MHAYRHLLVGIDFSDACQHTVTTALAFARRSGAKVTVAHICLNAQLPTVWPLFFNMDWGVAQKTLLDTLSARLHAFLEPLDADGVEVESVVEFGSPASRLAEMTLERKCDVVVVSSGTSVGASRFLLGSTTERLVRIAQRPVWMVHPSSSSPKRILVGVDYSPSSAAVLHLASEWAKYEGAELDVVHVYNDPGEAGLLTVASDDERHRYRANMIAETKQAHAHFLQQNEVSGWVSSSLVAHSNPAKGLLKHAASTKADLIVVGCHGYAFFHDLILGSNTERIMRWAPCSVVAVRGEHTI